MQSLVTVQKIFKVIKVVTMVFAVIMFVCAGLCLVSGIILMANRSMVASVANSMLYDFSGIADYVDFAPAMIANFGFVVMGIAVIGGALGAMLLLCSRYCGRVLYEGTPFTYGGADALMRLGIIILITEVAAVLLFNIITSACGWGDVINLNAGSSIIRGIALILLSRLFKYGADVRAMAERNSPLPPPTYPNNDRQYNGPDIPV